MGTMSEVCWEEEKLMEAWSMRLSSISSRYEPCMDLLQGIVSEMKGVNAENAQVTQQQIRKWQYFPESL